ncbi:MAG: LysM peptidoglycan-binding domain-containing protein [Chitinophagales bacterium]|nr:LysM peptidoglycan-binding domain-containing protein [Chitinophagales bacterium]MCZ2394580.1 LysM peptidoglycan-binding domain-containing protein [Chitinophagales bacterium]
MKKILSILLFFLMLNGSIVSIFANTEATAEEYIQTYKGIAISEMKRYGIPASIKLAQGLLESGMGTSKLAVQGNNHFGIKCHTTWNGSTMKHTDDAIDECFRVYSDPRQSYMDHSQFLLTRPRYANLFLLKPNDYKGWAYGLKKAGYATNAKYAEMLIDVIERHQLYVYDMDISEREMEVYRQKLISDDKEHLIALQKQNVIIGKNGTDITLPVSNKPVIVPHQKGGDFYNNKVKVVRMKKGETLKDISKRYNISSNQLRAFNDLTPQQELTEGQLVYLASKKNKAKSKTHLVLSHESLWSISQDYGIKLSKILEKNYLKRGEEPAVGTTLFLRKKALQKPALRNAKEITPSQMSISIPTNGEIVLPAKPIQEFNNQEKEVKKAIFNPRPFNEPYAPSSQTPSSDSRIYHTVQQGDTLYNISKKFNVDIENIKKWNGMSDNNIHIGQQLIIPQ